MEYGKINQYTPNVSFEVAYQSESILAAAPGIVLAQLVGNIGDVDVDRWKRTQGLGARMTLSSSGQPQSLRWILSFVPKLLL